MSHELDTAFAIRNTGMRFTSQRLKVAHALRHSVGHRTVEEIRDIIGADSLPLSTVYRAIRALKTSHLVAEVDAGGRAAYEWVDAGQLHHHLVCDRCFAASPLAVEIIERLHGEIRAATGFEAAPEHFMVHGICLGCRGFRESEAAR